MPRRVRPGPIVLTSPRERHRIRVRERRDNSGVFSSESQKACFDRVIAFAKEAFPNGVEVADGAPLLSVRSGSAVTFVSVAPMSIEDAVVTVRAYVVSHATITRELAVFLLVANTTTVFGAFGLSAQGDIVLEHNLIGSTLSRQELEASLITIARLADDVDDEIVARWGGERALDRIDGFARLMDFEPVDRVSH